jgi:hypothetical protein
MAANSKAAVATVKRLRFISPLLMLNAHNEIDPRLAAGCPAPCALPS